jgi:hypothetical protein
VAVNNGRRDFGDQDNFDVFKEISMLFFNITTLKSSGLAAIAFVSLVTCAAASPIAPQIFNFDFALDDGIPAETVFNFEPFHEDGTLTSATISLTAAVTTLTNDVIDIKVNLLGNTTLSVFKIYASGPITESFIPSNELLAFGFDKSAFSVAPVSFSFNAIGFTDGPRLLPLSGIISLQYEYEPRTVTPPSVPLPATLPLMLAGLAGLATLHRYRKVNCLPPEHPTELSTTTPPTT